MKGETGRWNEVTGVKQPSDAPAIHVILLPGDTADTDSRSQPAGKYLVASMTRNLHV